MNGFKLYLTSNALFTLNNYMDVWNKLYGLEHEFWEFYIYITVTKFEFLILYVFMKVTAKATPIWSLGSRIRRRTMAAEFF